MNWPNSFRELVELIDERVVGGRRTSTGLLYLAILVLGVFSIQFLYSAARAFLTLLPTSFPVSVSWRDWASAAIVVLLYLSLLFIGRRIRRLERRPEPAIDNTMRQRLDRIDERLSYVEEKVGDRLRDLIAQQILEERRRAAAPPIAPLDMLRLEEVRKVLKDAAAEAWAASQTQRNFSPQQETEREVLRWYLLNVVRDLLSHRVVSEFETHRRVQGEKDKLRNVHVDGNADFQRLARYLSSLADRLTFDDIDPAAEVPGSFAQYKRNRPWSST